MIIFDLDGNLVYTYDIWDRVGPDYLTSKGIIPPDNLIKIIDKMTLREIGEYFIKGLKLNKTMDQYLKEIGKVIKYKYRNLAQIKPGSVKFIQQMSKKIN